jgi:para-nitrobenzyl esterase
MQAIRHEFSKAFLGGVALAALLAIAGSGTVAAADAPQAKVEQGALQGLAKDGINVFRGVPFAAPPIGPLRFHAPAPPKAWSGVRQATEEPSSCPQNATADPAGKASSNEDCLYLNVYAPAAAGAKRPVMVWIHGGGWGEGFADARQYDPTPLVKEGGIVVVNIAYRLGALGLLATKALDEADGAPSGNYLIRDHQMALAWVKKNIAAFGGDPANVTIVGESAGANSTLALVASPLSKGLFERAIVQSGVDDAHTLHRATVEASSEKLAASMGCPAGAGQVDCLRKLPLETILKNRARIGIVEDARLFPVDPYAGYRDGAFNHVPMIIGSNLHEGYFFVSGGEKRAGHAMTGTEYGEQMKMAYGDDAAAAEKIYPAGAVPAAAVGDAETDIRFSCYMDMARTGASKYAPIYGFEMNEPDPAQQQPREKISLANTSYHTSDLAYLFDNDANGPLKGEAAALGRKMRAYWLNFIKTGSPNGAGLAEWSQFKGENGAVLNLSHAGGTGTDFASRHHCAALKQAGLVSYTWK